MLHINDLTFRMEGRLLLDRVTAAIPPGQRTGFVGRNGTGKSTLLKLITGEYGPESGSLSFPKNWRIGMVRQEVLAGPTSLLDTVLAADVERSSLLAEAETATDPHRISEIHTRLADMGAHAAPARAATILSGLGFDEAASLVEEWLGLDIVTVPMEKPEHWPQLRQLLSEPGSQGGFVPAVVFLQVGDRMRPAADAIQTAGRLTRSNRTPASSGGTAATTMP